MRKVIKVVGVLIITIVLVTLLILSYYKLADIQSKVPQGIKQKYNVVARRFIGRNVFVISSKVQSDNKNEVKEDGESNKSNNGMVILYFHGGSYVAEATEQHWEFLCKLVDDTGATAIMSDYPLTPKYTYKDVFEMVEPLYKEIVDRVDANNLVVMGDSAGGGLALALEEKIGGEELYPLPSKTILISPWLDVRLTNPEIDEVQKRDKELNKETLRVAGIAYAGNDGINSYLVNPIDGDLSKIKNLTILTGTNDILNPDAHLLQQKAATQGTNIDLKEYEGAGHIWMIEKNSSQELIDQGYNDIIKILN